MTLKSFLQTGTALLVAAASPAFGNGVVDVNIYNNEIKAEIEFANGIAADVTIAFENGQGLSEEAVALEVELMDPTDLLLLARLPDALISPIGAFPMKVSIEPPADGKLAFYGMSSVSIYTHNLGFSVGSPFRLFKAHDGGSFEDITAEASSGSYRVRGNGGEFSEFMIVADLRPIDDVITAKFDKLEALLSDNQSMITNGTLASDLTTSVATARANYLAGDEVGAIQELDDFSTLVRTNAGGAIPDLWRSRDDIVNLDGLLRAAASTTRYSLTLLANDLP